MNDDTDHSTGTVYQDLLMMNELLDRFVAYRQIGIYRRKRQ